MNEIDNGGPAFPAGLSHITSKGISTRDYFAGLAMQGDLIGGVHHDEFDITAKRAYIMADVMLKARKK